jgi:hypothetical protein
MSTINPEIVKKLKGQNNGKINPPINKKLMPQTTSMFAIGLVNILLIFLVPRISIPPFVIIMAVGAFTFFGWLGLCIQYSGSFNLNKGEIRKGILGSFLMIYFAVLALIIFGEQKPPSQEESKLLDGLTELMEIIIIFYFGSRTLEKWMERGNEATNGNNDQASPITEEASKGGNQINDNVQPKG